MKSTETTRRTLHLLERRTFLALASGGLLAAPLAAEGQQAGKVYTLGILSPHPSPSSEQRSRGPLMDRLRELGWVEGQNLKVERAYGDGREDRLPALAEELVRRRVDVIWALGPRRRWQQPGRQGPSRSCSGG